jgi:hypothetical protein
MRPATKPRQLPPASPIASNNTELTPTGDAKQHNMLPAILLMSATLLIGGLAIAVALRTFGTASVVATSNSLFTAQSYFGSRSRSLARSHRQVVRNYSLVVPSSAIHSNRGYLVYQKTFEVIPLPEALSNYNLILSFAANASSTTADTVI